MLEDAGKECKERGVGGCRSSAVCADLRRIYYCEGVNDEWEHEKERKSKG